MAKLWDWLRGSGKRVRELASAREAVEAAQRALLPYAGALDGALRAELEQSERDWREACAVAQRDDDASQVQACAGFARIAERLRVLRHRAVVARPDLAGSALVARALEGLSTIEKRGERCAAALELLAVVTESFVRESFERVLAEQREALVELAGLDQLVALVRTLDDAAKRGSARGLAECRARAVQRLHEWDPSDPEREGWLLALLDAQAEHGDLAGARAALAELEGDAHEQGLQIMAERLARRGQFEEARAALASIRSRTMRQQAELGLIDGLARGARIDEALVAARAAEDDETRGKALARIAGIRAAAGEREDALALVAEVPDDAKEDARFELLEADLARGDHESAVRALDEFTDDGFRSSALARLSTVLAHSADIEFAQAFAETIENPHLSAGILETLGWRRFHARDADAAQALFARALEIAGQVARAQGRSAEHPGRVSADWMILASRIQAALGDPRPALACVRLLDESQRAVGLREIGRGCGGTADVAAVDGLLGELDAFERSWLLCGAVRGLAELQRRTGDRT